MFISYYYVMPKDESHTQIASDKSIQDSKVRGANMGPTWVLPAPEEPHIDPMNLVIWDVEAASG